MWSKKYSNIALITKRYSTAPLVTELLQLPVPGYGTVHRHISEKLTVGSGVLGNCTTYLLTFMSIQKRWRHTLQTSCLGLQTLLLRLRLVDVYSLSHCPPLQRHQWNRLLSLTAAVGRAQLPLWTVSKWHGGWQAPDLPIAECPPGFSALHHHNNITNTTLHFFLTPLFAKVMKRWTLWFYLDDFAHENIIWTPRPFKFECRKYSKMNFSSLVNESTNLGTNEQTNERMNGVSWSISQSISQEHSQIRPGLITQTYQFVRLGKQDFQQDVYWPEHTGCNGLEESMYNVEWRQPINAHLLYKMQVLPYSRRQISNNKINRHNR